MITRRKLDEWTDEAFWPIKLTFIYRENFDKLYYTDEEIMNLNGVDAFFCTLGARQKHGAPQFFDVDYQYPYEFA